MKDETPYRGLLDKDVQRIAGNALQRLRFSRRSASYARHRDTLAHVMRKILRPDEQTPEDLELAGAKARLTLLTVKATNAGNNRIGAATEDVARLLVAHSDRDRDATALQISATRAPCMDLIDFLRADEGDSVMVLCDNQDGPPNNAIECNGGWTGYEDARFEGDTLLLALENAVAAKQQADETGHPVQPKPVFTPDFKAAFDALYEPLSWMQNNSGLKEYWGWNLAAIANDLIDRAYPGLRSESVAAAAPVADFRPEMLQIARAIGCFAADTVSDAFLRLIPAETDMVMERQRSEVATLTARVETLEGALSDATSEVSLLREAAVNAAIALSGYIGEGVSLDDVDAMGAYYGVVDALGLDHTSDDDDLRAALSPDPAVKPSAEGGAA